MKHEQNADSSTARYYREQDPVVYNILHKEAKQVRVCLNPLALKVSS